MRTFNHGSPVPSEDGETHMQCTDSLVLLSNSVLLAVMM